MISLVKSILKATWKIWFLTYMIFSTLAFYPILFLSIIILKNYALTYQIYKVWAWSICIAIGIKPSIKGLKNLPKDQTYILVANHTSQLDIVVPYTKIKEHFSFLAKEELKKAPLFNINFKGMNVTVNRKSMLSGKNSMKECSDKLKQKINLLIFPEGTRAKKAPVMNQFKNGPFYLAIEHQTPIVPLVFIDNYKRLGGGKGFFKSFASPGKSRMVVLPPIDTRNFKPENLDELKELVFNQISQEIKIHQELNN